MKMIAEYLEHAIEFDKMAAQERDSNMKTRLLDQAEAYRKLARERASKLKLPIPPESSPRSS